jgi:hypothetical protein
MIRLLLITLLFASCMTQKKAYRIVAADPYVDGEERVLLAQKCITVFPDVRDTPHVITVDSAPYLNTIEGLLGMIDTLSAALDNAQLSELGFIDTNDLPVNRVRDSLRYVKNFLKKIKLPPVIITKEVSIRDARWEALRLAEVQACRAEEAKAKAESEDAKKQAAKAKTRFNTYVGWSIAGGLALLLGGIAFGRLKRA